MPPLCSVCSIHGTYHTTLLDYLPICSDCTDHITTYLSTPNIIKKNGNPIQFDVCTNCVIYADDTAPLCMNCSPQMRIQPSIAIPNSIYWQNLSFCDVYNILTHIKNRITNGDKNIVPLIL